MNDPLSPQSPESQQRLFVMMALILVAMVVVQIWQGRNAPPPAEPDGGVAQGPGTRDAGVSAQAAAAADAGLPGAVEAAAPSGPSQPPAISVERSRPSAVYTFSSSGGGLTSAVLQGRKMREQP